MIPEFVAVAVLLSSGAAEWLHHRRSRRVARLAFGPGGAPRGWTQGIPYARVTALSLLAWGLTCLVLIEPRGKPIAKIPEGGYRHLAIALDVSPSMQLRDAGTGRTQTRAQRASEVLMSVLERIALDQVRVSIVAFYTGAKPVVVDTFDLEVVKNVLNDLPLDYAFDIGKTTLLEGVRETLSLATSWEAGSSTILIVSDGDTVPDTGLPSLPSSVAHILVLGVGDARSGTYIDGHQSRQEVATLRQLAGRLGGVYHDVNEKHLPSVQLTTLATVLPMRDPARKGRRELALAATGTGALVLALLPVALALGGSAWQGGLRRSRPRGVTPRGADDHGVADIS